MLQRSPRVVDGKGGVDVTNGDDGGTQLLEASGPEGGMILATKRTALAEITRSCNPRDEKTDLGSITQQAFSFRTLLLAHWKD
jgi:hypothetical protein